MLISEFHIRPSADSQGIYPGPEKGPAVRIVAIFWLSGKREDPDQEYCQELRSIAVSFEQTFFHNIRFVTLFSLAINDIFLQKQFNRPARTKYRPAGMTESQRAAADPGPECLINRNTRK